MNKNKLFELFFFFTLGQKDRFLFTDAAGKSFPFTKSPDKQQQVRNTDL